MDNENKRASGKKPPLQPCQEKVQQKLNVPGTTTTEIVRPGFTSLEGPRAPECSSGLGC